MILHPKDYTDLMSIDVRRVLTGDKEYLQSLHADIALRVHLIQDTCNICSTKR